MNRNKATGPGAHTPDGSSVELYKVLVHRGEADIIHSGLPPGSAILELGAGTGRVTHALIGLGHPVTAVDCSAEMLAEIHGATTVHADIVGLDLGRHYPGVVLGSCLVNVIESELRREFLLTCARHVENSGSVFIESHSMSALDRAKPGLLGEEENGILVAWREVSRDDSILTGTLEYRCGDRVWTQTFSTHILRQDEVKRELERCGLRFVRSLNDNWIEAKVD